MPERKGADREPSETRSALVQFEALRREFQVVLDGYKGIRERLNDVEAKVDKHHQELKKYLTDGLKTICEDVRKVESRLENIEAQR